MNILCAHVSFYDFFSLNSLNGIYSRFAGLSKKLIMEFSMDL